MFGQWGVWLGWAGSWLLSLRGPTRCAASSTSFLRIFLILLLSSFSCSPIPLSCFLILLFSSFSHFLLLFSFPHSSYSPILLLSSFFLFSYSPPFFLFSHSPPFIIILIFLFSSFSHFSYSSTSFSTSTSTTTSFSSSFSLPTKRDFLLPYVGHILSTWQSPVTHVSKRSRGETWCNRNRIGCNWHKQPAGCTVLRRRSENKEYHGECFSIIGVGNSHRSCSENKITIASVSV